MPRPRLEARAGVPHKPKRAFHGLRRFVVNELGDLRLAGWWVGQSSLRVTAGYERDRMERLNEARERLDRKETAGEVAPMWQPGLVRRCHDESGRVDLNHRPPGPETATECPDVRRNVVLTRCSGQAESYLGS